MITVLFDIDGTLLHTGRAGSRAFKQAVRNTLEIDDPLDDLQFAGATDLGLLNGILDRLGRPRCEHTARRFFEHLPGVLEPALDPNRLTVYEGALELLRELHASNEYLIGLLTGNVEACAYAKLRCAGLDGFFAFGGFGNEHEDRGVMAELALERARERGANERVFVIGDTPSDIRAAQAIAAVSIAVTTGHYDRGRLIDAGADHVIDSLLDARPLLTV